MRNRKLTKNVSLENIRSAVQWIIVSQTDLVVLIRICMIMKWLDVFHVSETRFKLHLELDGVMW